ncbi:MAG: rRNA maturation RNase YbeY [Anaerolineae bacterium]|nr:rRNA maturation RNase YbeY [Anaerolineae bacterium]
MSTESGYKIVIQIQLETQVELDKQRLQKTVEHVLISHTVACGTGVTVVIADDREVQRLNQQFRGVDAPTDALSFPSEPMPEDVGDAEPYLGDLILALPTLQRQAEAEGHALIDELVLAVVHGTLHLLGYDHDNPQRQLVMWQAQEAALKSLGVTIIVPLFEFPPDSESDDDSSASSSA